ncbi:haloacid dehalogenase type II [Streptomyces sp. TRM43335]|uniref:Haloacid dehalogenase type II n=1 Tax=Streptomyces taklimakanensis TaxID=2569853 RepID=A0A6G2B5U7_9ACTN|nr:haloacid dehalogenase type II [Streptomyces taklimakanensis]MTE17631.1 haloacid dehalogenase type II [Streptomyces taklimakanensis]
MRPLPRLIVFDVNETLSDMAPLRARFEEVGAPGHLAPLWFAGVLRDGFALTAAGGFAEFADLAADGLRALLADLPERSGGVDDAVRHVLAGLGTLPVHSDVPEGVRALREAGYRLAAMTNGAASTTERLLGGAGLLEHFEALLDVRGPRAWKPAPAAYRYATDRLGVAADETLLVAVHPWDVDGARRAGLAAAWLRRGAAVYPAAMTAPTLAADDLASLARVLTDD